MGQTISYYADPEIMPNPFKIFRSKAYDDLQEDRSEVWKASYTNGLKWVTCSLIVSVVAHRVLLRKSVLYPKIDGPRKFFIHALFNLGMWQYGLESKEAEIMKESRMNKHIERMKTIDAEAREAYLESLKAKEGKK